MQMRSIVSSFHQTVINNFGHPYCRRLQCCYCNSGAMRLARVIYRLILDGKSIGRAPRLAAPVRVVPDGNFWKL